MFGMCWNKDRKTNLYGRLWNQYPQELETFTDTGNRQLPKSYLLQRWNGQVLPAVYRDLSSYDPVEIKLVIISNYLQSLKALSPDRRTLMFLMKYYEDNVALSAINRSMFPLKCHSKTNRSGWWFLASELDCIDEVYGNFSMKQTTAVKVFNEPEEKLEMYILSSEMFATGMWVKYTRDENCSQNLPVFE